MLRRRTRLAATETKTDKQSPDVAQTQTVRLRKQSKRSVATSPNAMRRAEQTGGPSRHFGDGES